MASNKTMPRVDIGKDFANMNPTEAHYMKKVQSFNLERASKVRKVQFRNKVLGLALGGFVVGVYFYSMSAIKQEKFLDFEEVPEQKKSS